MMRLYTRLLVHACVYYKDGKLLNAKYLLHLVRLHNLKKSRLPKRWEEKRTGSECMCVCDAHYQCYVRVRIGVLCAPVYSINASKTF